MSTFYIDEEGSLWACGRNADGQVGIGDNDDRFGFTKVIMDSKISSVTSSDRGHTVALDSLGDLWSCGLNKKGQLGLGDYTNRNLFVKVKAKTKFNSVSCSGGTTIALDVEGNIWYCGSFFKRSFYKFVKLNFAVKFTHVKCCGTGLSFLLDNNGHLWRYGSNLNFKWLNEVIQNEPILVDSTKVFVKLACGYKHILVLDSQGYIWSMGDNIKGQLGLNDYKNRNILEQIESPISFSDIACGYEHSVALDTDGNVWSCGNRCYGSLGFPVLRKRGYQYLSTLTKLSYCETKILSIACASDITIVLNIDGVIETCGSNTNGQLGAYSDKIYISKLSPRSSNVSHLMNNDKKNHIQIS